MALFTIFPQSTDGGRPARGRIGDGDGACYPELDGCRPRHGPDRM